jgi:hypothetical protein
MNRQSTTKIVLTVAVCAAVLALASLTPVGSSAQDPITQNVAAVKQAAAENAAALKQYTWVERTTLSLKGETKNVTTTQVNYDVEGKLQKTPLSEPPAPDKKRGLRGKVAGSKTEDMKAYMEQVKALIGEYVPPSPERMQEASAAGRVAVSSPSADAAQLMFTDYARAGDQMTLLFDAATKKIRHIDIASALENKDPVSMKVEFQALPDGTNYAAVTTVDAPAKQIQVKTEQINFQKVAR